MAESNQVWQAFNHLHVVHKGLLTKKLSLKYKLNCTATLLAVCDKDTCWDRTILLLLFKSFAADEPHSTLQFWHNGGKYEISTEKHLQWNPLKWRSRRLGRHDRKRLRLKVPFTIRVITVDHIANNFKWKNDAKQNGEAEKRH